MHPIQSLNQLTPPSTLAPLTQSTNDTRQSFKNLLLEGITQVNDMQAQADLAVQELMTGGDENPAEVLTALQKADMSFQLMMQIRNKLVQAYQEIKDIRI